MTAATWLCLAFLAPLASFTWDIRRTPRDGAWTPRPKRQYPGGPLPRRPEGKAALKAEIALTPPGRHRAPELKPIKTHPDWPWDTQEFEMRWDTFFDGLPDDAHVIKPWAGAGR